MSLRGLEPRTFCMWGRCDDHYAMVTYSVKLFRSSQMTLINTVFYKISVSDIWEPFEHWKMSPRGLEPRTFCVWGRCDDHYTMVTHNVKLFRSCQITLINTAFCKISVSDNRVPFEHWKMSPRGLEPRTFCVWGRCDDHYTMVTHNVKIFRSCQNTLINTVFHEISVSDNRDPFEHSKMSPRGLEPRTFCVLGRCDDHYTMVIENVKLFRSSQITLISTIMSDYSENSDKHRFLQNISLW